MKKICCLFILAMTIGTSLRSQDLDDTTLSKMKLNFVVPDIPAFKVMGTDPTDLLRPSTPKALAVSMSSFNDHGKIIIPKAFALEISPALLLNSNKGPTELRQYAKNAVVNSFRISVGSCTDTSLSISGRNLAIGLRVSLIDEGDFATDTEAHLAIAKELRKFRINSDTALKEFAIAKGLKEEYEEDPDVFEQKHLKEFNKYLADEKEPNQKAFLASVKKLKEDYKKKHWNDEKLDLAIAVLSSSPDSLVKNLRFNQAQLWLTWAHKIGKSNKAQLLAGINSQVVKNLRDTGKTTMNNSYFNLAVPVRFLVGTNRVKGFAEGQYKYEGQYKQSSVLLNFGTELNIVDGIWVNFYGGFNYNTKTSTTSTEFNFNLKLTMPENFKFF